jgi:hypothetical protein
MATNTVPPIPFKTPMLNANGFVCQQWSQWFVYILQRVGTGAPTNLGDIQTEITALTSELQVDVDGLGEGQIL